MQLCVKKNTQICGIIYLIDINKFMSNFSFKKNLSALYNNQPSEPFLLSFGTLLGGTFITSFLNLFLGNLEVIYLLYFFFTWFWLRLVELNFNFLIKKNNKFLAFSLSWLFPILLICFLGLLHINLTIYFLSLIAAIDILFLFLINIYKDINLSWRKIVLGFVLGSILIGLSNVYTNTLPWINQLAYAGIVPTDYLRDAAVANAWSEYSSISHGIHGLLFEPYHVLFAIFIDPFMNENVNVIHVFTILANILVPTLLIYGCSKLIIYMGFAYISKNWIITLIFFFLTFSSLEYVLGQRSLLIATLLYISIIPLVFSLITVSKTKHLEMILLSILVPVTIFGRAFHGLFLCGLLFYFLFEKKNSQKLIILASIIFSLIFIISYFGQTDRASSNIGQGYYEYFLYSSNLYINSYLIPIILLIFFLFFKNKSLNIKSLKEFVGNKFLFFIFFIFLTIFVLSLRTGGFSDTFYQLLPAYWFLFFFLITPNFKDLLFPSKREKSSFKETKIKYFVFLSLFIVSVSFFKKHLISINSESGTLKNIIKSVRVLDKSWKFQSDNKLFINKVDIKDCKKNQSDIFCSVRTKIFGMSNLEEYTMNLYPAKMLNKAIKLSSNLNGVTAVYIHPSNPYWSFFQYNEGVVTSDIKASLYFMAIGKIPLIFGVKKESTDLAYSVNTAHKNSGTLKDLNLLGGDNNLCTSAKKVKVNNIIIFDSNNNSRIVKCK